MANDSDLFNKWEAGQTRFRETLLSLIEDAKHGKELVLDDAIVDATRAVTVAGAVDDAADKAFIARAMALPSDRSSELVPPADPDVIREARDFVVVSLAKALGPSRGWPPGQLRRGVRARRFRRARALAQNACLACRASRTRRWTRSARAGSGRRTT